MKILFLSCWLPYPTNNGSKLRIYNLLKGLAPDHQVTLLTFADESEIATRYPELETICQAIKVMPSRSFDPASWRARLGLFSLAPRSVVDTFSAEMRANIEQEVATGRYDLIIASQWLMASYQKYFDGVPAIFEEVEVGLYHQQYIQARALSERFRYGLSWFKHRHYIAGLLHRFQACTVVSQQEQQLLAGIAPAARRVEIVPNCVNLVDYVEQIGEPIYNKLVFTGSFRYHANYEAMVWFVDKVFPLVRAQLPDVQLVITGDHVGKQLPKMDNVTLAGHVADIQEMIRSAWISLVPLLEGGGTRLKILEAMALRTAVVATTKGAEGLNVLHGEDILIADDPVEFADAVVRLLREPELRHHLTENAYRLVASRYDWPIVMPDFLALAECAAAEECN